MIKKKKAIFLDRDGVLIYDPGHLHRKDQVELLPGIEKLVEFEKKGFILVIVSNQSVVARGLMDEKKMRLIDAVVRNKLAKKGVKIKASFYCPHHPEFTGECDCRKPKPGLIFQAIKKLKIDPLSSVIIGDKPSDLEAGKGAGIKTRILVKRNGDFWDAKEEQLKKTEHKADSLVEALKLVGVGKG